MNTWEEVERASTDQILAWAESQPWAQDMANCQQDAEWHAEGDVWTHTCMVVREVTYLPEWPNLDRSMQLALLFTALFHDSGKPETSSVDPESGRIRSPKHSVIGMEIGREVLRNLGCGLRLREQIAALVRFHGRPPYLLEKPDPAHELIWLSWLVDNRLLYLFALADNRGRQTLDTKRPEENIHLWRMIAEENECFDKPYAFANDHARFLFYRQELSSLYYVPRADYRCTVTLMSGLPASGKDTWLATNRPGVPVVSLDELRTELGVEPTDDQGQIIRAGREACKEYLRAKRDFALNATNTVKQTRERWVDLFADYGARIEIVYVEPPLATILERNGRRANPVPSHIIRRLLSKLEPPTWMESHSLELVE